MKARSVEKNRIEEFLNDLSTNVCICGGRCGMGKSYFLKSLVSEYQGIYFNAYSTTDEMELNMLSSAVSGSLDFSEVSFDEIMAAIKDKADQGEKRPYLFVIDSYPDFVKAQADYDTMLSDACRDIFCGTNVKVILCGDSFINMKKYCLDRKSPWMKLNPTIINFEQLSFTETIKYINEESDDDCIFLYGITGGLPVYVSQLENEKLTREEAVKKLFFTNKNSSVEEAMKKDLREPAYYNRLMQVLSSRVQRVNEISAIVNKPKDIVVPYLKTLIKLSLVKKETPVTEKNNRRKTRYSLKNKSDVFWYRFVVPSLPIFESTNELPTFDDKEIEEFERDVFIEVCKEYLMEKSSQGELPFILNEIGNWWENNDEDHTTVGFDAVGLGKNEDEDASVFCRCYYSKKQVEIQELKELIELTKKVRRRGDNFYMMFSASGFSEHALTVASAIKNIILVDLDSMIKEARNK